MDDSQLMTVYEWIDSIPLSREKKNMTRDFSDGVLAAEILKHYYPKLVELHNYPSTFNTKQKLSNWNTLCIKVLKKINFSISQQEINDIINYKQNAIEMVLFRLYNKIVKNDSSAGKSFFLNKNENEKEIKNEIKSLGEQIKNLLAQKDILEKQLKETEEGNIFLQRQLQQLMTQLEYLPKVNNYHQ
jgi:hypothetical protein